MSAKSRENYIRKLTGHAKRKPEPVRRECEHWYCVDVCVLRGGRV